MKFSNLLKALLVSAICFFSANSSSTHAQSCNDTEAIYCTSTEACLAMYWFFLNCCPDGGPYWIKQDPNCGEYPDYLYTLDCDFFSCTP